jgi:integrase
MFLQKRNGRYHVVFITDDGRRTSKSTGTAYKKEAQKFLVEFKSKIEDELMQLVKPITINRFAFTYLRQREPYFTDKTIKVYKTTFKFLEEYFGNIQLAEINRSGLEEYFHKRALDSSIFSARKDLINLSSAFNYAVSNGYLLTNPCKGIKRFKLPERQPLFYTKEDFKKLLDVIEDEDLKDLVIFAVNTGLRQMELIMLEWRQINLTEKFLTLDNNNGHITKSKRIRTIPLNSACVEILQKRFANKISQNVFTLIDKPIDQGWLSRDFKHYVVNAGLNPKLNFHSLRHTYASWLVQAGVSIYIIQQLLGHADISTTAIYSHLRREDLTIAVKQLEGLY